MNRHPPPDIDTNAAGQSTHILWDNLDVSGAKIPEFHARYKNSRGRVPRLKDAPRGTWKSRVVVPFGARQPYVEKIKARVGTLKAIWAYAASRPPMMAQFPDYITNHFSWVGSRATAQIKLDGPNPSITFGGPAAVAGPTNTKERIQFALKLRAKAMADSARLMISNYNKDVAQSIRPKAHAKEHAPQEEAVD